ncbi:MAG: hypothetical protein KDA41_00780 [Planctomycetales bacterium]|nr:hypothetical protein [Planctomycetales bacterium]
MALSRREMLAAGPLALAVAGGIGGAEQDQFAFQEFTAESEESARRGVDWLMKTLHRDGGCGIDIGQETDIGCTAMVGLALLAQGNTEVEGPRSREVRKIVNFLLRCVDAMPNDDITTAMQTQLQNKIGRHAHTFFTTLFLSQVMGEGFDAGTIRPKLGKLVTTICRMQTSEGHWGGTSWAPTLGTVMGWCSLRGSHFAGFAVEANANKTADHLVQVMKQNLNGNRGGSWMHTLYKNATGVRVLYAMGRDDEEIAKKAFADCEQLVSKDNTPFSQAGGEEYLAFHLITETMLQKGGADWKRWYPTCRDKIIGVQNNDGSWTGKHCITSRTFCTAAAVLVLSAPNRYLPISQQ